MSIFQRAAAESWEAPDDPFSDYPESAFPHVDDILKLEDDDWRVDDPSSNDNSEQAGKLTYSKRDVNGTPHRLIFHHRDEYNPRGVWTHGHGIPIADHAWRMSNWTEHADLDSALEKAQQVARPKFSHGEHGLVGRQPGTIYHIPMKKFDPPPVDMQSMSAAQTPGQRSADDWLRAVKPEDIERLIGEHRDDPRDEFFGVPTGGGGIGSETEMSYPLEGHYNRRFSPGSEYSESRRPDRFEGDVPGDRPGWDLVLGQAGFEYKPGPNSTVHGFYWRPDELSNSSSLGYRIEHPSSWEPYWKAHYGQGHRDGGAAIAASQTLEGILSHVADHHSSRQWRHVSAISSKPKKPRKPEEVWYDVHKHPDGVPGGMGKSPEHHLRNRGWSGHEIHGATTKTIQYHNQKYPDFVISYGGGSGTKPDHNFGITYLGTNVNVPKKHRAYSVAEAMNKVEELHQLQAGHVVLPMTHDSATQTPKTPPSQKKQPGVPTVPKPAPHRDMTQADSYPDFPNQPERQRKWWNPSEPQLKEIPDPPAAKPPKYTAGLEHSVFQWAEQETWESSISKNAELETHRQMMWAPELHITRDTDFVPQYEDRFQQQPMFNIKPTETEQHEDLSSMSPNPFCETCWLEAGRHINEESHGLEHRDHYFSAPNTLEKRLARLIPKTLDGWEA